MNRLLPITIKMGALAMAIVLVIAFVCIADALARRETIPSAKAATPPAAIPQELAVGAILPRPIIVKAEAIRFDARRLIFAKIGDELSLKLGSLPEHSTTPQAKYKSTDESIATVDENGTVTAAGWGECRIVATAGDFSTECAVNVAKKWVALTFDDGPRGTAKAFLKELQKKHVAVTFFVLGELAETKSGSEALRQMVADGHEIGNHSFDHTGDPAKLAKQILRTDKIVKDATGKTITLLRPPYGKLSDTTKNSGELVITWNVDSFDWKSRNADAIVARVLDMVTSGDIVLMHDIYSATTSAALRIISALKEKGYAFVTVSDILEDPIEGKVYNHGTKEVRTMKVLYE